MADVAVVRGQCGWCGQWVLYTDPRMTHATKYSVASEGGLCGDALGGEVRGLIT